MKITTGIDLIEIERVAQAVDRHGQRFLSRVFTPTELAECSGKIASLAARFAAKEAVAKAMGTGIGRIGWQEIEIVRGASNEPLLRLYGMAAELTGERGFHTWSVSLSHTNTHATAVAVAIGE